MPSHELPQAAVSAESADNGGREEAELEDVHELQDHEFTLELEDTVEIASGPPEATKTAPPQPPLPRWAAASRALLDSLQALLDVDSTTTVEIAPTGSAPESEAAESGDAEASARDKLTRLALQMHAREVYCHEIERALIAATGRVRGQAFRIAELELELREANSGRPESAADSPRPAARPARPVAPAPMDDLRQIRGIGPRFAARLAELGVTTFETLANWNAADITNMAQQLGVRRERITQDSWVKQARALRTPARRAKRKTR